ncbi:Gfo/Idh/MocA family protein [Paenibacillus sp. HJGM_3]|uniref:Gfo/Idh/MocA family protein n=1 Tax=Paenibacillus sp. HJGM_3 TaxID=3379816 RepID=UPI00385819B1
MTIKVGIAGARGLSSLQGFKNILDTEVVALCDLDGEYVQAAADKHGIPRTYRIFEDMLESDIDAAVISTPMQLHVPQAIQAMHAGKHVMSEVTAAVTMDELWWLKEMRADSEWVGSPDKKKALCRSIRKECFRWVYEK